MNAKKQISFLAVPFLVAALVIVACGDSDRANSVVDSTADATSVKEEGPKSGRTSEDEKGTSSEKRNSGSVKWTFPAHEIAGINQEIVGRGPRAAVVLTPSGRPAPRWIAIYLHHWTPLPPSAESDSIQRLIKAGNTVIYPAYQELDTSVSDYLPNAVAGTKAALASLDFEPRGLVTVGQSTGGALAFDMAATAAKNNLPKPVAAIAVAPGRNPQGVMPRPDYGGIAPSSWLMAVQIPNSKIPGSSKEARRMLMKARNVPDARKELFRAAGIEGQNGKSSDQINREFWRPILEFMTEARASEKGT